ncbi:response regulator [Bacillus sp. Au-Bac7]|uniref:response regulator n=1 Tax=Bacillus sp. Au-Bac7 TaxID=2906458 RepID=UPI002D7E7C8F|nr:response regulator [Bacillus sp. Au-Bac7]
MAKILVTDDASFMRMQIKEMVTKLGHEVVGEASNGREAIKQFIYLKPDLTIMDIVMPEMTGIEAIKEIKKYSRDAKIIICSSMGQKDKVLEALKEGAIDFIVKPFNPERFNSAITKAL